MMKGIEVASWVFVLLHSSEIELSWCYMAAYIEMDRRMCEKCYSCAFLCAMIAKFVHIGLVD